MMQRFKFQLPVLWLTYSLLTGCAYFTEPEVDPETIVPMRMDALSIKATTFVYECPAADDFTVSADNDQAWVFLPEETLQLKSVPTASGVKYANDTETVSFWNKGEEAILDLGATQYTACKNNRSKAIWENAKLKGVDFRALGNEPGWIVEMGQRSVVFVRFQPEMVQHVFKTTEPVTDAVNGESVYTLDNDDHDMQMTISEISCQDSMSGESFESKVTVKLDGQVFIGCGKALH
ncbi:MAG: hypothetical protein GQ582_01285 [Methyloprofundus sp.]|nr:hypothetical protein [Methyloprofundus sp.]